MDNLSSCLALPAHTSENTKTPGTLHEETTAPTFLLYSKPPSPKPSPLLRVEVRNSPTPASDTMKEKKAPNYVKDQFTHPCLVYAKKASPTNPSEYFGSKATKLASPQPGISG